MSERPGSLMRATLTLLSNDKRTIDQIAQGSGLPRFWILALKEGRSKNPGVNRIQQLYEFLRGEELPINFRTPSTTH